MIDFETTGLSPAYGDRATEVAVVLMAVVLHHGVLFRNVAEGRIGKQVLEANRIEDIIGVATNLFYGTGIPACILVLIKQRHFEHQSYVLIFNVKKSLPKVVRKIEMYYLDGEYQGEPRLDHFHS